MTDTDIVQEPHDEFPDLLAGEQVAPDHDLDLESFDLEWDDEEPVDAPPEPSFDDADEEDAR